jgi:8-oxo-dGTP pyrophosphatase MutT (NUDIX family)
MMGGCVVRKRDCAGGVVFTGDRVLIIQNEKGEWALPKGVIRDKELASDVAIKRVRYETGIDAHIIAPAGETRYEFYSVSRKLPVSNRIDWFIMQADRDSVVINKEEGILGGGFFTIQDALDKITYSQDKSLVRLAYDKYRAFQKNV